ncbi:MAG: Tim44 domain-containing protein [Gluconacetobacter diazotrophicus]|nr:Tim44 domain-containing protein [Gluconacetobacter diazotrophicus]
MQFLAGNYPVDLVLLGLLAAFLVLRLRSVLGKRTGLERPAAPPPGTRRPGPVVETRAEPATPPARREVPAPETATGLVLNRIRDRERGFDPRSFLEGAEAAFRRIVQAYAEGDRATLRQALTPDAFAAFEGAIAAREAAGEVQRAEIRTVTAMNIVEATLVEETGAGGIWRAGIEVRIVSDQVSLVLDRAGQPVSGTDAVTELADSWTFERLLGAPRSADGGFGWRLAAARSA